MKNLACLAVPLVLAASCTTDEADPFGDDGTPVESAAELMGKNDAITNDRLAGVYEKTGSVTGYYPGQDGSTFLVTNDYVYRIELRATMVSTAIQCTFSYQEPGRASQTVMPFVQQAAELSPDSYRVTVPGAQTITDPVSMSDCAIDQPADVWAFCEETIGGSGRFTDRPEGANRCIGRDGQYLWLVRGPVPDPDTDIIGTKVAD
jgi:hypothetical protein